MNSEVEDKLYERDYRDEVKTAFSDEGLVNLSLENKKLKLDTIRFFLEQGCLREHNDMFERPVTDLSVKREGAFSLKCIQNQVKAHIGLDTRTGRKSIDAEGRPVYHIEAKFFSYLL